MEILVEDLGLTYYKPCWDYQEKLFQENLDAKKNQSETKNHLLLTEHHNVFTLGKSGDESNVLGDEKQLDAEFYKINRGGDITFHGPGQLVVYPIIDLEKLNIGLAKYIFNIEEVIIRLIAEYDIQGVRSKGASGVWLDIDQPTNERKICAVGVRASRHITMHGLAFNVNTELSYFDKIIPCGIPNKGVTSLSVETNKQSIGMNEIKTKFVSLFREIFEFPLVGNHIENE